MATNQEKTTRGVFYAFTRVILFVIAILIIALGFFTGMNSMNVNVIIKDAFELREEYVLQPNGLSKADLEKLFTQECIQSDPVINSSSYQDYDITSYYQRADVGTAIVWPWMDSVTVRMTENVLDIQGSLNSGSDNTVASPSPKASASPQAQIAAVDKMPPQWKSAEYDVTLVKDPDTSSWKVQEMAKIKEVEPVINEPSQMPSSTQSGKAAAKSSVTPSAAVSSSASAKSTKSAE